MGTRNHQEKILNSFGDISEKVVFFDFQMCFRVPSTIHHPPTTTTNNRTIKKCEVLKKPILRDNLKAKKLFPRRDIRLKEIKLGPRREPSKGFLTSGGHLYRVAELGIFDSTLPVF